MTDAASFERQAIDEFTKPWSTRRGIEFSDKGHEAWLVRAPPAEVTAAFVRRGARSEPDALGDVQIADAIAIVVRFAGHSWTTVLQGGFGARGGIPTAAQLSGDLHAPVLDVVSWEEDIQYTYFERGRVVERMVGNTDGVETFESSQRPEPPEDAQSGHDVANVFLEDQDANVSDLRIEYFFSDGRTLPRLDPGTRLRVTNPGVILVTRQGEVVSRPELDKLAYLSFAP